MLKNVLIIFAVLFMMTSVAYAGSISTNISEAGAAAGASITDNSKNKVYDRDFVNGGGNVTAGTHAFFTEPTDDSSFRRVMDLIRFGTVFSEGALKNLAKGGDAVVEYPVTSEFEKPDNVLRDGNRYIMIVVEQPEDFRATSPCQAKADDGDTTSFQIIAKLALKAISEGDNVLYLTEEGFHRKVEAGGWGIGTHVAGGSVSDNGKISGVGGGGFGISQNEVGPEDRPWVHGYGGSVPELDVVFATVAKVHSYAMTEVHEPK
jgi:hypothetical protein